MATLPPTSPAKGTITAKAASLAKDRPDYVLEIQTSGDSANRGTIQKRIRTFVTNWASPSTEHLVWRNSGGHAKWLAWHDGPLLTAEYANLMEQALNDEVKQQYPAVNITVLLLRFVGGRFSDIDIASLFEETPAAATTAPAVSETTAPKPDGLLRETPAAATTAPAVSKTTVPKPDGLLREIEYLQAEVLRLQQELNTKMMILLSHSYK